MPHRTTVVELSIDPVYLSSTVQAWAINNKFFLYQKDNERTIYSKSMRGAKAWLAIETPPEHARLEAWLASPAADPEFTGNLWLGWKMALPEGFGFGPPSAYRKQFDKLLTLLNTGSTSNPVQKITFQDGLAQPDRKQSTFTKLLLAFGIFYIVGGLLSLASGVIITLQSVYFEIANTAIFDGFMNLILGVLFITSARALNREKVLGLWLYGAGVLFEMISTLAKGGSLNYVFVGFALLMTWQIFKMKKEWKLA